MSKKPALQPQHAVDEALRQVAHSILRSALAVLHDPSKDDAAVIHDFRTEMKRWRALLRLLAPFLGKSGRQWRIEARDLARELAGARDAQSALDALNDLSKTESESSSPNALSPRTVKTIASRLEEIKKTMEAEKLNAQLQVRLDHALNAAAASINQWPIDAITFGDVAGCFASTYRRARRLIPEDWSGATPEELHELRQRVIDHRYQMELVEPLWPRLGRIWIEEAQRVRSRLGTFQDLTVLARLTKPHEPLARWHSRLSSIIAPRQADHVAAAARIAARLFAEPPKAFRRRIEALWEANGGKVQN